MRNSPFMIIGNWKSNKTVVEALSWFEEFNSLWKKEPFDTTKTQVILCPAYIHLKNAADLIKSYELPVELGAQDLSAYPNGTYTGEVSAEMVGDLVKFSIIGHSERRKFLHETEGELALKIKEAISAQISPIYCIQDKSMLIPEDCQIVAYEPVWAISHGDPYQTKPETPENADFAAGEIKKSCNHAVQVIYGGSTTPENVASYVTKPNIDGVLPGGASLKADVFYRLIQNASGN